MDHCHHPRKASPGPFLSLPSPRAGAYLGNPRPVLTDRDAGGRGCPGDPGRTGKAPPVLGPPDTVSITSGPALSSVSWRAGGQELRPSHCGWGGSLNQTAGSLLCIARWQSLDHTAGSVLESGSHSWFHLVYCRMAIRTNTFAIEKCQLLFFFNSRHKLPYI